MGRGLRSRLSSDLYLDSSSHDGDALCFAAARRFCRRRLMASLRSIFLHASKIAKTRNEMTQKSHGGPR